VIVEDLPLLGLFIKLREAGLPLGIDEYRLLLRALQSGFGINDQNALARLCRTLWVKSPEEARLFDYYFEQMMAQLDINQADSTIAEPLTPAHEPSTATPTTGSSPKPPKPGKTKLVSSSKLILKMEDEIQVAQAVRQDSQGEDEIPYSRFILTDEYFPVTRRQMKQSWRYLRRMVREGPLEELDVPATVTKIGQQGVLLAPVLVPRRVNRAELILLIDQDGSMVPFHALSRRLAETALRGGRLGKAGIYYFHNCPVEYLYHHPTHQEAEPIHRVLDRLYFGQTTLLIFSDAGAARGSFNPKRVELTNAFFERLKQKVRHVAWLNPIPRSRWQGTSANEIARFVPMFEVSRRGLDDAIAVLRGRLVHFKKLA